VLYKVFLFKYYNLIIACGITYRSLKYINSDDIRDAISNVGLRAEFREKLFFWRKSEVSKHQITYINIFKNIDQFQV